MLAYSTVPVIERELAEFAEHWNTHMIRSNKKASCPSGIPDDLYDMPLLYGKISAFQAYDVKHSMYISYPYRQ